ncbi:MAG: C39 family peptidase [Candidatus Spechtbacteria bacterium]|nr:C39 family peptidase [Candidatus Spechtbacteria bacterium]
MYTDKQITTTTTSIKQSLRPINTPVKLPVAAPVTPTPTASTPTAISSSATSLSVPFISQAPLGNWADQRQEAGCEEASVLMAMLWVRGKKSIAPLDAESQIITISDWEQKMYGEYRDTKAQDTIDRIFKGYFGYSNVELKENITTTDIKAELERGNMVIVPVNGRKLRNPFYVPPGPIQHNILIRGYDSATKEFITNDSGTRRGEKYRYAEDVLYNALQDYPTGNHEIIFSVEKVMIVVKKTS